MGEYVVAVDVGTGSARAGVIDRNGRILGRGMRAISLRREDAVTAEHSSEDIWAAVTEAVRTAVSCSGIDPNLVDAIGFDATCSLTFLDAETRPLSIARDGTDGWDTIAWLDHRALEQAQRLSSVDTPSRRHAGGSFSPEMQIPKLMWVRENLPGSWARVGGIFDLSDYLTFRATGTTIRSATTLTTKWSYLNHSDHGWDQALLEAAGLDDLPHKAKIEGRPVEPGSMVGTLCPDAAEELDLPQACRVAAGMVDAYAGALALAGAEPIAEGLACLVGGTSTCVMRFCPEPFFASAFWGPYFGVALPGFWVSEGGQSAAGALLDHILQTHPARPPGADAHAAVHRRIAELLEREGPEVGRDIHVLPDFHGSRTPFADYALRGTIHGLSLDPSFDGLARLYWRAMVGLALGVRQIAETLGQHGQPVRRLALGGGHAKGALFRQLYADATGCEIEVAAGEDAMLIGTAMAAASAAGWYSSLSDACRAMRGAPTVTRPKPAHAEFIERDYRAFLLMQEQRRQLAELG